jgi:hypothetical protein
VTESEAYTDIRTLTNAEQYPRLSADQLDVLLRRAKRADAYERVPSDSSWIPTWDIAYAVALGWEQKAANAAAGDANHLPAYDIRAGDEQHARSQIVAHCQEQAKKWRGRSLSSLQLIATDPNATIVNNPLLFEDQVV